MEKYIRTVHVIRTLSLQSQLAKPVSVENNARVTFSCCKGHPKGTNSSHSYQNASSSLSYQHFVFFIQLLLSIYFTLSIVSSVLYGLCFVSRNAHQTQTKNSILVKVIAGYSLLVKYILVFNILLLSNPEIDNINSKGQDRTRPLNKICLKTVSFKCCH